MMSSHLNVKENVLCRIGTDVGNSQKKKILALLRVEGDICALLESNKKSHDSSAAQRSASLSDPFSHC